MTEQLQHYRNLKFLAQYQQRLREADTEQERYYLRLQLERERSQINDTLTYLY
jgi:hypothetical protein